MCCGREKSKGPFATPPVNGAARVRDSDALPRFSAGQRACPFRRRGGPTVCHRSVIGAAPLRGTQ